MIRLSIAVQDREDASIRDREVRPARFSTLCLVPAADVMLGFSLVLLMMMLLWLSLLEGVQLMGLCSVLYPP